MMLSPSFPPDLSRARSKSAAVSNSTKQQPSSTPFKNWILRKVTWIQRDPTLVEKSLANEIVQSLKNETTSPLFVAKGRFRHTKQREELKP